MMSRYLLPTLLALALSSPTLADTINLKSGDTLTGTIKRIGPDTVDLDTNFAGLLHIQRDKIKTLRSDAKVLIVDPQGESHTAYVAPLPDATGWHESEAAATPTLVAPAIPAPTAAPAAKAVYLNLEPWYLPIGPHWKNQFTLGLLSTTGNTDSTTFATEADFKYDFKPHEFTLKLGANYAVSDGDTTSNQAYFDTVYRRTFPQWDKSERWYGFAENHELYDAIKGISLRSTSSFGPGYFLFKGDKFNLDLRSGPAFVYERVFDGSRTTDFDALVGLRAEYVVNDRTSLTEDALYTVAVIDSTRYQITSDTALAFKIPEIAQGAGLKISFTDDYDNTNNGNNTHNDTRFTLGLTLDF
jgi:putative salt-induced outer membrane protein YdiY